MTEQFTVEEIAAVSHEATRATYEMLARMGLNDTQRNNALLQEQERPLVSDNTGPSETAPVSGESSPTAPPALEKVSDLAAAATVLAVKLERNRGCGGCLIGCTTVREHTASCSVWILAIVFVLISGAGLAQLSENRPNPVLKEEIRQNMTAPYNELEAQHQRDLDQLTAWENKGVPLRLCCDDLFMKQLPESDFLNQNNACAVSEREIQYRRLPKKNVTEEEVEETYIDEYLVREMKVSAPRFVHAEVRKLIGKGFFKFFQMIWYLRSWLTPALGLYLVQCVLAHVHWPALFAVLVVCVLGIRQVQGPSLKTLTYGLVAMGAALVYWFLSAQM